MKVKEVSVVVSRTFNLGNFNSLRVEGGCVVTIEDGDDLDAARTVALNETRETLRRAYVEHRRDGSPQ